MNSKDRSWAQLLLASVLFCLTLYYRQSSSTSADIDHKLDAHYASQVADNSPAPASSSDIDDDAATDTVYTSTDTDMLHPRCYRENPTNYKNRPVLLFKYSRTGSTWLAWTGKMLELENKKQMLWNWEVQDCSHRGFDKDGLVNYMVKYYTRDQNGTYIDLRNAAPDYMKLRCLHTVNPDVLDNGGPLIATINPHETHEKSPPLVSEHWKKIFDAVPNLAVGVLVRTNSVKRAISFIASEKQREQCGTKKLKGDEDCIKNLPKQLNLNTTQLWKSIRDSELKRVLIPELAAQLSEKYGDGKIFCLTYEAMEKDMTNEMKAFGKFIGAEIGQESLAKLKSESRSYKRGSDDLSTYIENYDEVREKLSSSSKCILDQLESLKTHAVFHSCNVA